MDYLVCPNDGSRLKADAAPRGAGPLVVRCPTCTTRFTLTAGGLRHHGDEPRSDR